MRPLDDLNWWSLSAREPRKVMRAFELRASTMAFCGFDLDAAVAGLTSIAPRPSTTSTLAFEVLASMPPSMPSVTTWPLLDLSCKLAALGAAITTVAPEFPARRASRRAVTVIVSPSWTIETSTRFKLASAAWAIDSAGALRDFDDDFVALAFTDVDRPIEGLDDDLGRRGPS